MVLYQKYRPQDFDDFIGNKKVIKELRSLLARDRKDMPHVFLFYGPAGTGKTSIARVLAAKLECTDRDLQEWNSASFRGIDTARELIRSSQLRPNKCPCRVWIIDECHKWTKEAQEALLKLLEDTPRHVYILLCTTNPEMLLKTVRSRCHEIGMESVPIDACVGLMKEIIHTEGFKVPDDVLEKIAEEADGCLRQALMVLDKIRDLDPEDMKKAAQVVQTTEKAIKDLCQAMMYGKPWKVVAGIIPNIAEEPESIRRGVLGYLSAVLMNKKTDTQSGKNEATKIYLIMSCFKENYFYTGKSGLILSCFEAVSGSD